MVNDLAVTKVKLCDLLHILFADFQQILALKLNFAIGNAGRGLGQDAQDGAGDGCFACAGFAHQADGLAFC